MSRDRGTTHRPATQAVLGLFLRAGCSQYGGESVSQIEHALQTAAQAEAAGVAPTLIAAALLHDLGHLLHDLPDDAPDRGVDDRHEWLGARWLTERFTTAVVEPVRLHVAAKRYLCAVDPLYLSQLSEPSLTSLKLQGGVMSAAEVQAFEATPFAAEAVQLRRWDEAAKQPGLATPPIEHFAGYLDAGCLPNGASR